MLLDSLLDVDLLRLNLKEGYIRENTHPCYPSLKILNYTEKTQFEGRWDGVTDRCRGLIYESDSNQVAAIPFKKFHNYDQHGPSSALGELPDEPFDVYDKLDGSLGIFFHYRDRWLTATRGSFQSEQAEWAHQWLYDLIEEGNGTYLDPKITYLAEIIYPENRIVVDYKGRSGCILLGGYSNITGKELRLAWLARHWPGPTVRQIHGPTTLAALASEANDNAVKGTDQEGYVIRFRHSGQRTKIKFADYKRIHGLFTETNEKTIWAVLAAGGQLKDLMDTKDVPDELYQWCREIADELNDKHTALVNQINTSHRAIMDALNTSGGYDRKRYALAAQRNLHPTHLKATFLALDHNHVKLADWAWRQLEPRHGGRRP